MTQIDVLTPCIGVCSTAIGDTVCRGCKRFNHEVIHWNAYAVSEKQAVDARLARLLSQVVQGKLRIVDSDRLQWQLEVQQVRFFPYRDRYCALYELLRAGATQIDRTEDFGFVRQPAYRDVPLESLRDRIDQEWYALSEAYYQRYLRPLATDRACGS